MYNPKHGERVIFRINPDGIDLYGTAVSESASNMALIQEDVEDGQIWAVPASQIQPDDEADATPSFWEAAKTFCRTARVSCDLANDQELQLTKARAELWKTGQDRDYWKNRAEITHLQHVAANKRADDAEADRDGWAQEAKDNLYISRIGYEERDQAQARVKELEAEVAKLQTQTDAAPYATGYPVGDRVAARLAEYRERTHAAEAERDELRKEWLAAEERVFELGQELDELKAALRTLAGESK